MSLREILYSEDTKGAKSMLSDVLSHNYEKNLIKKSRAEGKIEGKEEESKKAYADKIETAKILLQENVSIKIISKSTKLTIEEIESLIIDKL